MCVSSLFGGGKPSAPPPPPVAAPPPLPTATESQKLPADKDKLSRLRQGLASTIKTGGRGLTGGGADLAGAGAGKKALSGA